MILINNKNLLKKNTLTKFRFQNYLRAVWIGF